jgi:hypothetical protein
VRTLRPDLPGIRYHQDIKTKALKAARTTAEVAADNTATTYTRLGVLKGKDRLMAVYNEKRKYGVIPQPAAGEYPPDGTPSGIFANAAVVHQCV